MSIVKAVRRELSHKAKLSVHCWSWFRPSPMITGFGLYLKEQDHIFLGRVAGLSLHDWVKSSAISECFYLQSLLPEIYRSLLKWFKHLVRMLPRQPPSVGGLITTDPARGDEVSCAVTFCAFKQSHFLFFPCQFCYLFFHTMSSRRDIHEDRGIEMCSVESAISNR